MSGREKVADDHLRINLFLIQCNGASVSLTATSINGSVKWPL